MLWCCTCGTAQHLDFNKAVPYERSETHLSLKSEPETPAGLVGCWWPRYNTQPAVLHEKKVVFLVSIQPRPSASCFPRMPRRQPPPFHVAASGSRSESSAQASRTSVLRRTCESADFPPQTVHSVKIKTKQPTPSKPSISPARFEERGLAEPVTPQAGSGGWSSAVPKPLHGRWVCWGAALRSPSETRQLRRCTHTCTGSAASQACLLVEWLEAIKWPACAGQAARSLAHPALVCGPGSPVAGVGTFPAHPGHHQPASSSPEQKLQRHAAQQYHPGTAAALHIHPKIQKGLRGWATAV